MNIIPLPPIAPAVPPPLITLAALPYPGIAATAAPLPQVPGVQRPPSTFAELYNWPAADAHGGVYEPTLALFAAEPAAGQHTPVEIRATLDAAGDAFLQAYLMLGTDGRAVTVHTVT